MGYYDADNSFDLGSAVRMDGRMRRENRRGHCEEEAFCSCECSEHADCANTAAAGCGECSACGGTRQCNGCSTDYGANLTVGCNGECIDGETHVYFESCDGVKEVTLNTECHNEDSLGRVLDVSMTLCNMCPGRRCAVGVTLTEMDDQGAEYARGFRAITVPAHNAGTNRDVALPALRFVLPEDIRVGSGRRHFVVRTTNHYVEEAENGWGCGCKGHK